MGKVHDPEDNKQHTPWSRRQFLRRVGLAGAGLAALPILAACGGDLPTPTRGATASSAPASAGGAASAAPASAGGAASAAPASSAAASSAAGASAAASARPSGAASGAPASAAAASAAPPTPTVISGIPRAKSTATVSGKYIFIQNQDFHPDHNAFLRTEITEFCKVQGWTLDISYTAGFAGTGDLLSAISASVQAGTPPDAFFHDISTRQYQFQGVLDDVDALTKEAIQKYGDTYPGYKESTIVDNLWYGLPFHGRAGGEYIREDWFKEAGLDPIKDTETYDKLRESALKISDPAKNRWGWGLTVNRSGDGTTNVQQPLLRFGSKLQDESGELIKFNTPETIAGFNWLKETYSDPKWSKMLPAGVLSWTDTSNNEAFLAGTIGITDNAGTMYAKAQLDKVPHANNILFVRRPKRNSDMIYIDNLAGARLHMVKGSKNKAASADLFRHLISEPVAKQLYTTSLAYVVPAYKNLWNDPIIQGDRNAKAAFELAYADPYFAGYRIPGPPSAALDTITAGTFFTDAMAEILQGKAVADVVKDYEARFVQIYRDFNKKGA